MAKCYKTIQNPDYARFAQECIKRRTYLDWSQADVAGRANISRASVAHVENGTRMGSLDTAARIARVLGIEITRALWPVGDTN